MNPHPLPDLKVWGQLKFAPLHQKVGHTLVRSQEEINCLCPLVLCVWFHCKTSFSGSGTRGWNMNMWQAWSSYKTVNDRHFLNLLITLLATMHLSFQVSCHLFCYFPTEHAFLSVIPADTIYADRIWRWHLLLLWKKCTFIWKMKSGHSCYLTPAEWGGSVASFNGSSWD